MEYLEIVDVINNVLPVIKAFASNPIGAGIGAAVLAIIAIIGGIWYNKKKKEWRKDAADENREQDKTEDQDDLEDSHTQADRDLRDRLNRLGAEMEGDNEEEKK